MRSSASPQRRRRTQKFLGAFAATVSIVLLVLVGHIGSVLSSTSFPALTEPWQSRRMMPEYLRQESGLRRLEALQTSTQTGEEEQERIAHITTSQDLNNKPSSDKPRVMAVLARYFDDIGWLTDPKAGLIDNSTGQPQLPIDVTVYQAADMDFMGNPIFPGLPLPNATDLGSSPMPGWPSWAADWVERTNKSKSKAAPGTAQEAEYELRKRLGLPEAKHAWWQGWKDKWEPPQAVTEDEYAKLDNTTRKLVETSPRSSTVHVPEVSRFQALNIVPNHGAEAMMYLTAIIDHYDDLPDFMVFMHGHRASWHMVLPQDWSLRRLAAHPPTDRAFGYLPLGCHQREFLERGQIFPSSIDANWDSPQGPLWHEALAARYAQAWREHLGKAYDMELPDFVKLPCGATFISTKEAILRRPKRFYEEMRDWLLRTTIEGKWLGIVMEFNWQIILENKTVIEMSQEECLCRTYQVCTGHAEF